MTFEVGNYQFLSDYSGEQTSSQPAEAPASEGDNSSVVLRNVMAISALASLLITAV